MDVYIPVAPAVLVPGGDVYVVERDIAETMDTVATLIASWSRDEAWPERCGRRRPSDEDMHDERLREKT